MSDAPYVCDDDDRRRAVRAEATINGIDFLEVDESQTQLDVTFIHPLPGEAGEIPAGPELEMANLLIEGGVRIAPVTVTGVSRPDPRVLRVTVDPPGDFSPYTFRLIAGAGAEAAVAEALALAAAAGPVRDRLRGFVRVGERRWDAVFDRDQRILLPEEGAVAALERAVALDLAADLLARDVAVVDLRMAGRPTLRLTADALEDYRQIKGLSTEVSGQ